MDPSPNTAGNAGGAQSTTSNWFCHECQWEGLPLHAPDPTCPRCSGSFIEEIDGNSGDDPREFDAAEEGGAVPLFQFETNDQGGHNFRFVLPGGGAAFLGAAGGNGQAPRPPPNPGATNGAGGPLGALMAAFGWGPNAGQAAGQRGERDEDPGDPEDEPIGQQGDREGQQQPIRNLADFLANAFGPPQAHDADGAHNNPFAEGGHERADAQEGAEAHPAPNDPFAAFAAAMNGQQAGGGMNSLVALLNALGAGVPAGRQGDFVFGEGAFQNILDRLAEQAGRAGPNPATKEIIDDLPRQLVDSEFLASSANQDCVICQESYTLHQTILTLPCKFHHNFHEECIVPWLKSSGTCPTCRYHLVPQPEDEPAEGEGGAGAAPRDGAGEAVAMEDGPAARAAAAAERRRAMSGGQGEGALPGSWPESEAERTRAASRNRERAQRETAEDDMPVLEDLD